jgi:predicted phage terminase large subunit-like protein
VKKKKKTTVVVQCAIATLTIRTYLQDLYNYSCYYIYIKKEVFLVSSIQVADKVDIKDIVFALQKGTLDVANIDFTKIPRSEIQKLAKLLTPKMTKYIPHVPTPKQAAYLLLDNKEAFFGGAAGGGKALCLTTPILTDSGWSTIGKLTLDDKVLALDGTWTEIEYITEVQKQHDCYALHFNNGEVIVADKEHLWKTTEFKHRKYWKESLHTTCQLEEGVKIVSSLPTTGSSIDLGIDPYVFGFWLGDGNAHTGSVTIGKEDITEMLQYLPSLNRYESMELQYTVEGLTTQLNRLGVLRAKKENRQSCPETKCIPTKFFLSSHKQRLALLQGLMDSEGHCQARGRCEISLKECRLFDDVCTLLSTLGIIYSTTATENSYRATFSTLLPVFKLTRKKSRLPKRVMGNKIIISSIKYIGKRDVKCIRIKHPSHIFLCGTRLIPTHNSDALLMAGLQYVDIKGYAGIIFRKTYADLTKPGALIDRAKDWLFRFDDVRWDDKNKKFDFIRKYGPHTEIWSILQFGYMENENHKYNYQGGEYQFIGWDEVTHIIYNCYKYMFSRMRRLKGSNVPLRVRSASNPPDDDQGIWVFNRFVNPKTVSPKMVYIPAGMDDNPHLDKDEYAEALDELDPVTRARLRDGNWEILRKGNMFKRNWFEMVDSAPTFRRRVRFWDMAATDEEKAKKKNKSGDPDYTVGLLISESNGFYYIEDIIRVRKKPADTEIIQRNTAISDGYVVTIREEQEPGSSGIAVIDNKMRTLFKGYNYNGVRSTGNKVQRAGIASAASDKGLVKIVKGCRYLDEFFNELEGFPGGVHDDMVDAFSGGFTELAQAPIQGMPLGLDSEDGSYWTGEEELGSGYFGRMRGYA